MTRHPEDTPTSPYAILGVSRHATPAEIKRAFHAKAKSAHPDAGGNVAAMAAINAAYKTLIDHVERRHYDEAAERAHAETRSGTSHHASHSAGATTHRAAGSSHATADANSAEPVVTHVERRQQARRYVWSYLEEFGLIVLLATLVLTAVAVHQTKTLPALGYGFLSGLPVYWLLLQLTYIAVPDLKLIAFDTVRSPVRAHPDHRRMLAIIILAAIPVSAIWAAGLLLVPRI